MHNVTNKEKSSAYEREFWTSLGDFLRTKVALKQEKRSMCTLRSMLSSKGNKTNQSS
jgi:hypothetical protein